MQSYLFCTNVHIELKLLIDYSKAKQAKCFVSSLWEFNESYLKKKIFLWIWLPSGDNTTDKLSKKYSQLVLM